MPMSKSIVALLPLMVQSLALSRGLAITDSAEDGDDLCDAKALYKARQVGNDWKALKGNPCMSEEDYKDLESGKRDPDDNVEILGHDYAAEFVDADMIPGDLIVDEPQGFGTMFPKVQFIGLPHSGSTSLAEQMNLHPELSYGLTKEHNIVVNLGKTSDTKLKKIYLSRFALRNTSTVNDTRVKYTFDASPATMFFGCPDDGEIKDYPIGKKYGLGVKAVRKVQHFLGSDTKYIIMLRDPIDWQISHSIKGKTIQELLGNTSNPSDDFARSCYADCIEAWVRVVGKNNILFLDSDEYFKNPQGTLHKITKFVGVETKTYTKEELGIQAGRRRAAAKEGKFPVSDRKLYWQDPRVKECKARLTKLSGRNWHWGP